MQDIVLIHGAWAGSWVWDGIVPGLRAAGFRPHALDLPGNGSDGLPAAEVTLERYVEHVLACLARLSGRACLVAHSGGGVTATQVAEAAPDKVAGVIYVAGMMLPSGMSFAELMAPLKAADPEAAGIVPHLRWNDDRSASSVPPEAARRIFFQNAPAEAAVAAAARLSPQPERARAASPRWTAERFGRVPRLYIEALEDRSVVPAAQRRMQALVPGARVVSLRSDHAPQLSAPAELLVAMRPFLAELAAAAEGTAVA